jgi:mannose-1-phosphate guanylyltransferase/phosphomannomutase
MKALILCAGYGTRLKPLTNEVPKPLVRVMGIPVVEYTLNLLAKSGIKDLYINRHHLPDEFENIRIPAGINVEFSYEPVILGTSGGILSFEDKFNDDFLVVNGDVLFNIDVNDLISFHKKSKKIATMVLRGRDNSSVTPVFKDDFSNVVNIGGEANDIYQELMFTGIHILGPAFFKLVKRTAPPSCVVKDFYIPYTLDGGKVGAYVMDEKKGHFWKEIGDLKSYLECNMWMIRSVSELSLKGFYEVFVGEYWESRSDGEKVQEVVEDIWLGDGVSIDPGATLIPPVFIGPRVILKSGTVIGPNAILGADVIVEEGSIVTRSVILDSTTIKEHTTIDRMVVHSDFKYKDQ